MIKLTRSVVERLFLLCLYGRENRANCYHQLENALGYKLRGSTGYEQRDLLNEIYRGEGLTLDKSNWDYLLGEMTEALIGNSRQASTAHHSSLIETVVDILTGPYAKNVLSGKALTSLRRAVLLPEELAKVAESARKELHCGNCSKTLVDGEMVRFSNTPDGVGVGLFCSRCVLPTHVACRGGDGACEGASTIDQKVLSKAMGKRDCGQHEVGQPAAKANQDILAALNVANNPFDLHLPPQAPEQPQVLGGWPPQPQQAAGPRHVVIRPRRNNAAAPPPPDERARAMWEDILREDENDPR